MAAIKKEEINLSAALEIAVRLVKPLRPISTVRAESAKETELIARVDHSCSPSLTQRKKRK